MAATCEGVDGGDLRGKEGVDGGGERRLECEGEERLRDLGEKARKIGVTGREAPSVRALFFSCFSAVWALDCFSVLRSRQCACQARKKVSPSVHEIPGRLF